MPRFTDLVSKWTFPLLKASPELRELIREQAGDVTKAQLAEAQALAKMGQPVGWASTTPLFGARSGSSKTKPGTGISFQVLRELSTYYWCARACINKRQEQIHNLSWGITSTDPEDEPDEEAVKAIEAFFKQIAGPTKTFRQFLDMVVDDLLTLDGAAIYLGKSGKKLKLLWPVDASTIRIRVDESGMLPTAPDAAYEQWIRGQLVASMTTEEMSYLMMNARTSTPYGLSPLESLVLIVNAALKSEVSNLGILSEGNIPEGIYQLPKDYSTDQIKDFQQYWDAMLAGDPTGQRRLKFMPGGDGSNYIMTKKPSDMEFGEMEKWLAVKTCAMFGVSPQSIGMTFDINKATASEQATLSKNESIRPLASLLTEFFNHIIQLELGRPDLQFAFQNLDVKDAQLEAEVNSKYIAVGVKTINEVRKANGDDPVDDGDEPFVLTAAGPVLLKDIINPPEPQPQPDFTPNAPDAPVDQPKDTPKEEPKAPEEKMIDPVGDLKRWRKVALKAVDEGKAIRKFQSDTIDPMTITEIEGELQSASTPEVVRSVFRKHISLEHDRVLDAAGSLLHELETILKSDGPKPTITVER